MRYFRCSDVGFKCEYEASGETEEEVMAKVEQHAREKHQMNVLSPEIREKIRQVMREER
ncbi:MAG: DUF1059 domain-containing protein [Methanomicrobiaceae archaeon]|nr:DUF1059 domain-containing protein [Methanomicrobiaceae archaeon]